jgi:hypothetical protein
MDLGLARVQARSIGGSRNITLRMNFGLVGGFDHCMEGATSCANVTANANHTDPSA